MYSASSMPNPIQFNNRPGGTPCSIGHKYQRMGLWASVIIRTVIFGVWPFSSLFLLQSVAFILQSLTFFFYPFGAYARKGKGSNTIYPLEVLGTSRVMNEYNNYVLLFLFVKDVWNTWIKLFHQSQWSIKNLDVPRCYKSFLSNILWFMTV